MQHLLEQGSARGGAAGAEVGAHGGLVHREGRHGSPRLSACSAQHQRMPATDACIIPSQEGGERVPGQGQHAQSTGTSLSSQTPSLLLSQMAVLKPVDKQGKKN